ncbi:MAG: NAD(P)/FAD-dependent oxidoreductase [Actinomycetota bacterium]
MTVPHPGALPTSTDVVVVGAGLAGLVASRVMERAGLSVALVESSDGVGGRVRSDTVDGFTLDRGFQVLLTGYPELANHLDIDALDLRRFEPGAIVWRNGRRNIVSDPFRRPLTLASTALAPVGSPLDKARIALLRKRLLSSDPRALLRGADTSTVTALRDRGFSPAMIERFFRPLVGGIQLDPDLSTSVRMFDVIFRTLADGDSAVPARGMGEISAQLSRGLERTTVHLGTRVARVSPGRIDTTDGRTVAARAIVVATEGPAASALLGLPEVASRPAGCVWFDAPAAPVRTAHVVLDGTGEGPVLNVAVMSTVAPEYAPPGRHLVAAALPGVADGDLESMARAQLRGWWGPRVDQWRHLRTDRIPHGQPGQSPPFHPKKSVALGEGLFVCGDHRDTGSIQGAMFSGRRCADSVIEHLAATAPHGD